MSNFTSTQKSQLRTLVGMFHPDKVAEQYKETATKITQTLNKASDQGDWFTVSEILRLTAFYGVTKNDLSKIDAIWDDFDSAPKHSTSGPKPKAERKEKAKPTVSESILREAKEKQNASGWDRKKMAAWLGIEFDLFGPFAKVYLDEIFRVAKGTKAKTGWASQLYNKLAQQPMTRQELADWITSTGSNNVKQHETHYWAICELANAIWASK
jgi:hypothetical protein